MSLQPGYEEDPPSYENGAMNTFMDESPSKGDYYSEPYKVTRRQHVIPMESFGARSTQELPTDNENRSRKSSKKTCCIIVLCLIVLMLCAAGGFGIYMYWFQPDAETSTPTWSEWNASDGCATTAAGCQQLRTRRCLLDMEDVTGCVGDSQEYKHCDIRLCEQDSNITWTQWNEWSNCISTGAGCQQLRSRTCVLNNEDAPGCPGDKQEFQLCDIRMCSEWSTWGHWSTCSAECMRSRTRRCLYGTEESTGCSGVGTDSEGCSGGGDCPVWVAWGLWSTCSAECLRSRTRQCLSGGAETTGCPGNNIETEGCSGGIDCPEWSLWQGWTTCSKTCCGGEQVRTRQCLSRGVVVPGCLGQNTETHACNEQQCPIWTTWSSWNTCSASCCGGDQSRTRTCSSCDNPSNECPGSGMEKQSCNDNINCPVWSAWGGWGSCSASCCGGLWSRTRTCSSCGNPSTACPGSGSETQSCNDIDCPAWAPWSDWGTCSQSCCGGDQSRTRTCLSCGDPSSGCQGSGSETQTCNEIECPAWTTWGSWDTCSQSCCGGDQSRTRTCLSCGDPSSGCQGSGSETQTCNEVGCPAWTTWGSWDTCSLSCCGGDQSRTRTCISCGDPSTGCPGSASATTTCNNIECPVWSAWRSWSICPCGGGQQSSTRTCTSCGSTSSACSGPSSQTQSCSRSCQVTGCPDEYICDNGACSGGRCYCYGEWSGQRCDVCLTPPCPHP